MIASVVDGEWRWQPYQNLLNSVFIPYMSASVIECRSIGSCSSSGLCAEARSVAPRKARYLAFLRSETNRC